MAPGALNGAEPGSYMAGYEPPLPTATWLLCGPPSGSLGIGMFFRW